MEKLSPMSFGIAGNGKVYRNLPVARLVEKALERGEGVLAENGALAVRTGKYTGRSPNDKFFVDTPAIHDTVSWGKVNVPISKEKYDAIKGKMLSYLQGKELFVFDGFGGADPKYTRRFRIVNELASQNLFIHQLLIRPTAEQLEEWCARAGFVFNLAGVNRPKDPEERIWALWTILSMITSTAVRGHCWDPTDGALPQ